jgi:hypothetical protein
LGSSTTWARLIAPSWAIPACTSDNRRSMAVLIEGQTAR